jgi:AcrR family transcriptional regulator
LSGFSVTKVARRAGVAKGTVSLRWPEPLDLVVDAFSELAAWEAVPDLGSLRDELRLLADRLVRAAFTHPMFALSQSVLVSAAARPELWERYVGHVVGPGLTLAREVFVRAQQRGEIAPAVPLDPLVLAFVGGLQMATEADPTQRPPDDAARDALVDVMLAAAACLGRDPAASGRGRRRRTG